MSNSSIAVAMLEYRDASLIPAALPSQTVEDALFPQPALDRPGVPEEEVQKKILAARESATADAEERFRREVARLQQDSTNRIAKALHAFEEERVSYFSRAEREIVQLALAIARKILERESMMDPTLLSALVRIAIDRMQCESRVLIRVRPEEVKEWHRQEASLGSGPRWEVIGDKGLSQGDCIVETELGSANFGFEAQLKDVEETFLQLLAQRPAA